MLEPKNSQVSGRQSVQIIDSTIVRARRLAAEAKAGGAQNQDLGNLRGGFSTKINLRASGLELPIAIRLSTGEVSDMKSIMPVLAKPSPEAKIVNADKSYDSDEIRKYLLIAISNMSF